MLKIHEIVDKIEGLSRRESRNQNRDMDQPIQADI